MATEETTFQLVASRTRVRIREHQTLAPEPLWPLLRYLEDHLFETQLSASYLKRRFGSGIGLKCQTALGSSLSEYIREQRLMTGWALLRDTDLAVSRLARFLGYSSGGGFAQAMAQRYSLSPKALRKRFQAAAVKAEGLRLDSAGFWSAALHGALSPADASALLEILKSCCPSSSTEPKGRSSVDLGRAMEDGFADQIWQAIRDHPFEIQRSIVLGLPSSTALSRVLRQASVEVGDSDREHGVKLAELAVESLEGVQG